MATTHIRPVNREDMPAEVQKLYDESVQESEHSGSLGVSILIAIGIIAVWTPIICFMYWR